MAIINPAEKGIGVETRGKIGKLGDPDPRDVLGIYRIRRRWGKVIHEKLPFYTPTNPQTDPQQSHRLKIKNLAAAWQGLTDEQKDYYNNLKEPENISGQNRYIHFCFYDPSWPYCPMPNFLELSDTPASYSGQAGKYVLVNSAEDALEFGVIAAANKALSNLENVAINISLIPGVDSAIDIGSDTKFFANAHIDKIWFDSEITLRVSAADTLELANLTGNLNLILKSADASATIEGDATFFYIRKMGGATISLQSTQMVIERGGQERIVFSNLNTGFPRLRPYVDSTGYLGDFTRYWSLAFIDRVYLNATAILDGVEAGHIRFTGDLVPKTDDTEWIGEIGSPFKAIKGLVIKDTTDGKHYKVEVVNGVLTATALD